MLPGLELPQLPELSTVRAKTGSLNACCIKGVLVECREIIKAYSEVFYNLFMLEELKSGVTAHMKNELQ